MEALQRLQNRGSVSTGYDIDNSCKFEIDNSECLTKTFGSSGNRKAWTWSSWVKRTELNSSTTYQLLFSAGTGNPPRDVFFFDDDTDDTLCFFSNGGLFSSGTLGFRTDAVFRDTSAWYHIVLVLDTANSTAADRLKLYVNGVSQTFSTYNAPTQNADSLINSNTAHAIARDSSFAALGFDAQYFSGYMAETHFVDGSALAPTEFGEVDDDSGIWKPKQYTGSHGSNGFYLDFSDSANLGDDESGNGNDFTEVNLTAADQATDTPTNNFATWNVLDVTRSTTSTQGVDMVEGAMSIKHRGANGWTGTMSNIAVSKGKWYWEAEVRVTNGSTMWGVIPVSTREANVYWATYIGSSSLNGAAFYDNDDGYYHDATFTACTIGGSTFNTVTGDVIMIAVDMDNNKLFAGVNGSWCNSSDNTLPNATGITILDEPHFLATATYTANTTNSYNFGGFTTDTISSAASDADGYGTFEYAPPSGYYALCTKNLEEYG